MRATLHRVLATVLALTTTAAQAADPPPAGKLVFDRMCAECHAPGHGHPGTQQLAWTRGDARSVLEQRTDLPAAYIRLVVRSGLLEMPAFRPTEITDDELRQLTEYLTRPRKKRR
jgi:mono/diheme cytochrome c family protein